MDRKPNAPPPPLSPILAELLDEFEARHDANPTTTTRTTTLAHGRTATWIGEDPRPDVIEIRGPEGALELSIAIDDRGPRLQLRGVALEIVSAGAVAVRCDSFRVEATRGVSIAAPRGGIELDAADEVVVVGERILLN